MTDHQPNSADNLSQGQLKTYPANQRPRQSTFDFKYDDEDTVMNEIEEFYSYIEIPQLEENLKAWEGCFPTGWCSSMFTNPKCTSSSV